MVIKYTCTSDSVSIAYTHPVHSVNLLKPKREERREKREERKEKREGGLTNAPL